MANRKDLIFTFVNPNTPEAFRRQLRRVLIDRLVALCRQRDRGA